MEIPLFGEISNLALFVLFVAFLWLIVVLFKNARPQTTFSVYGEGEPYKAKVLFINDEELDSIQDGKKKVDGRAKNKATEKIEVGDLVYYRSKARDLPVIITAKREYKTIDDFLAKEKLEEIFPGLKSVADARAKFVKPTGYYAEEQVKDGFYAIEAESLLGGKKGKK